MLDISSNAGRLLGSFDQHSYIKFCNNFHKDVYVLIKADNVDGYSSVFVRSSKLNSKRIKRILIKLIDVKIVNHTIIKYINIFIINK